MLNFEHNEGDLYVSVSRLHSHGNVMMWWGVVVGIVGTCFAGLLVLATFG